jgi:[acyl-carrier-protein] S-malonyltransferase
MKTAFVFPGQGSQQVGMGKDLFECFGYVKALYAEASEALGYDVARLSFEGPAEELNQTMRTQPCLLTASIAALKVLSSQGVEPSALAGHSLGEYSALVAAGSISFPDALRVTEARGRLMQEAVPAGRGLMAAILGLEREKVNAACRFVKSGLVSPANYNCPGQIVISGEREAVEEAMGLMKEAGAKRVIPLSVSVPSHCRLMEGASRSLSGFLSGIPMKDPGVPLVSNADASFLVTADEIRSALVRQLSGPVLWEDSIKAMTASGVDTFIEVGPGKVLSGLIKRIAPEAKTLNVEDRTSLEDTLRELG